MRFYRVDTRLDVHSFVLATNKSTAAKEARREVNELVLYLEERGWDVVLTKISEAVLVEDEEE